jgi:hypothetical protein
MRKFGSLEEVAAACLPPWQNSAVTRAVRTLESIFGTGFSPERGFVVLVEDGDTEESAVQVVGVTFAQVSLETTWQQDGCLLNMTLWGNSGDGVTWVCPDRKEYAPAIRQRLLDEK